MNAIAPCPERPVTRTDRYEPVDCLACGAGVHQEFILAEDDLTGRPGVFRFVRCSVCGLVFQSPRIRIEHIGEYYGDEYLAHRRRHSTGWLGGLLRSAFDGVERRKDRLVRRFHPLNPSHNVLDVGCGAGGFLSRIRRHGARTTGLDFKDLSRHPGLAGSEFVHGLFPAARFGSRQFHLITMWHFLEHDYDPLRSLEKARELLADEGRLIVEVPRLDSLTWRLFRHRWPGLQAPQHTVLFDKASLLDLARRAGLEVIEHLPYGAFPGYFYLFLGVAFQRLRGRGLNVRRAIIPYLFGQLLLTPVLCFERKLNLAMQTIICRRRS